MRIDQFYQFIVPLAFLAIWALTSLFNREVQPLPPRPGRPTGPTGPRPSPGSATARAGDRRPEPTARDAGPVRPAAGRPAGSRNNGRAPDDDILIIESETGARRPGGSAPPRAGTPSPRRPAKPTRGQAAPPPKRSETTGGRPLTGSTKSAISHPQGLTPLSLPPSPLLTSNTLGAGADELKSRASEIEPPTAVDLQGFLRSPSRVRESILLKEILDRPVSLRHRPFGRRFG